MITDKSFFSQYKFGGKVLSVNNQIKELERNKEEFIRAFILRNLKLPVDELFYLLVRLDALGSAIFWYKKAFETDEKITTLQAKTGVLKLARDYIERTKK